MDGKLYLFPIMKFLCLKIFSKHKFSKVVHLIKRIFFKLFNFSPLLITYCNLGKKASEIPKLF